MVELLSFLVGSALTLGVTLLLVRRARLRRDAEVRLRLEELEQNAREKSRESHTIVIGAATTLDELSQSVGAELSSLASGVEGHAQRLCEALEDPEVAYARAEDLWSAVRRLRLFVEKVASFATRTALPLRPVPVRPLFQALREEIEAHAGRPLEIMLETAPLLHPAICNAKSLHDALLFVVEALLSWEPEAARLSLRAMPASDSETETDDALELTLAAHCDPGTRSSPVAEASAARDLTIVAARNLIMAQQGQLEFHHEPGIEAFATLFLQGTRQSDKAADDPEEPESPEAPRGGDGHHEFFGALVVEQDASIRLLLTEALERSGRKPVSLGDCAAASALFERTPERFETLVVAVAQRPGPAERLVEAALARHPDLRVLLVGPDERAFERVPAAVRRRSAFLKKPFGALELRSALATLFGGVQSPR